MKRSCSRSSSVGLRPPSLRTCPRFFRSSGGLFASGQRSRKNAPLLSEMIAESRMARELCGYIASVAVVAIGFMMGWPKMVLVGQIAAVAVIATYLAELLRVFRH